MNLHHATAEQVSVDIGGVLYGARVRFRDPHRPASTLVTSARVHAVSNIAGGKKRLVFARSPVAFSETVTAGPRDTREDVWTALCGGNAVWTPEPARFYSWLNPRSLRGNDGADRAVLGDTVRHGGRAFPIVAAKAFGSENATPAWQEEPLPVVVRTVAEMSGVRIPVETLRGPVIFDEPGSWSGLPAFVADAGVYTGPTKRGRQETLGTGPLGPKYWQDAAYNFRLGNWAEPELHLVWYEQAFASFGELEASGGEVLVLDGGELTAPLLSGNFDVNLFVVPGEGGEFGQGHVEVRFAEGTDRPFLRILWDGPHFTGAEYRLEEGGPVEQAVWTPPATPYNPALSFPVRFVKTGRDLAVRYMPPGGSEYQTAVSLTDFFDDAGQGGHLAVVGNAKATGFGARTLYAGSGTLLQHIDTHAGLAYQQDVTLPTGLGTPSIRNTSLDVAMSPGSERRRDRYQIVCGALRLWSEAEGDEIVITYPAVVPSGGGMPPRAQPGTINFTDGEMRAGWRDYVDVEDPDGLLGVQPGEEVEIRRERVFDAGDPPTIEVREKGTGSWTALSPPDITARWTEGEIYLSQALLDTLPQAWELRAAGKVYRQSGNCRARQANELASAIDALDKLWVSAGTPGGAADAVGGSMQARIVAQTSESCSAGGVIFDGWGMGQTRGFFAPEVGDLLAAGAAFPYWRTPTEWRAIVGSGVMSYTPAHVAEWFQCTSGGYNRSGWHTPSQRAVIHTAGTPGAQGLYFGEDVLSDPGWPYAGGPAFNIEGVPWNLRGLIARLYDGAEIIEAKVPVRMQGLRVRNWSFEHTWQVNRLKGASVPNAYESRKLWINGTLHKEFLREDGVVVTDEVHPVDMWKTEGPVAFALVGRREHVQQVYLPLHHGGRWADQPVWQYRSFGSGLTTGSTASDGKWRMVDCRSLVQDALRARSSRYTETYLWPTNVGMTGDGSTGALTTYLRSLESSVTFNASLSGGIWTITQSRSGQYTEFDGVQFGEVLVRFRLPGGLMDEQIVPIVRRG